MNMPISERSPRYANDVYNGFDFEWLEILYQEVLSGLRSDLFMGVIFHDVIETFRRQLSFDRFDQNEPLLTDRENETSFES